MDERCPTCGARRLGDVAWCGQCHASFGRPSGALARTGLGRPPLASAPATRLTVPPPDPTDLALPAVLVLPFEHSPVDARLGPGLQAAPPRPGARDSGPVRTAVAAIALGAAVNLAVFVASRAGAVDPSSAVRIELWVTMGFYALVAALVLSRARRVDFLPIWTEGDGRPSGVTGAAVGLGAALAMLAASWAVTGAMTPDRRVTLVVSEGTWTRIGAAFLLTTLVAPLIEEILFRGLVTESLRPKGQGPAVLAGAVLFSLWHLNGPAFFYYLVMGVALGRLYWRRGLKCSLAAHAAFNGCVTLVAVVLATGPSHTLSVNGVSAEVPAAWHAPSRGADPATTGGLVAEGPSGSALFVVHRESPGAPGIDVDDVATRINAGTVSQTVPTVAIRPGSARVVQGPGWRGVRMSMGNGRGEGEVVVIPRGDRVYQVTLVAAGSERALADFGPILESLSLP